MTATTTPAKNPLTQKNVRTLSIMAMVFPLAEWANGAARAAFLQSFVGNGVRPVLRRKIKSNQIVLLHSPSRKAPARASKVDERIWPSRVPDAIDFQRHFVGRRIWFHRASLSAEALIGTIRGSFLAASLNAPTTFGYADSSGEIASISWIRVNFSRGLPFGLPRSISAESIISQF